MSSAGRSCWTGWSSCSTSSRPARTPSSGTRRRRPAGPGCSAGRWPARHWSRRRGRCRPNGRCTRCTPTSCAPGDPNTPITYSVDRLRDGGSFTTRRVLAEQRGQTIFAMSASFQVDEPGLDHQLPMPDVPDPESLPTLAERIAGVDDELVGWRRGPRAVRPAVRVRAALAGAAVRAEAAGAVPGLVQGRRNPARRPGSARLPGRLPVRHHPARRACSSSTASRPARTTCRWPRWTTRCGSTGRSARTSGCSTTSVRPMPPVRARWVSVTSSARPGQLLVTVVQEGLVRLL